eukprot:6694727-Pyramimonas_sp.AAC.1
MRPARATPPRHASPTPPRGCPHGTPGWAHSDRPAGPRAASPSSAGGWAACGCNQRAGQRRPRVTARG